MKNIYYELKAPLLLAFFQLALLITFHGNYNYFRDELYYIACSNHLDWGFVDQPPLSLFILKISRLILGDSLYAIRFLPALASSVVVFLAGMIAKKLGGGTFAQGFTSFCVVASPGLIGHGRYFSMNAFDILFWTVAIYLVVSIIESGKTRLWIPFGIVTGLGLQNKYSIGFLYIGIAAGLLLTSHRKHLFSSRFWFGVLIAALIFLPHVLWELAHDLPSLEFMRNASSEKNIPLTPLQFFTGQLRDMNFANALVWISGIFFFFFGRGIKQYRLFGWMYIVVFLIMIISNAKVYYLSPIYPVMLAGGAIFIETLVMKRDWNWLRPTLGIPIFLLMLISLPFAVPVLPVEQFIAYEKLLGIKPHQNERSAVAELPQYYADQFGWEEFAETFAAVYKTLTPEEQAQCVIYVRNYGEAGAIDFYGKQYGLPDALCAHNSYWFWGPGTKSGDVAIIVGSNNNLEEDMADLKGAYEEVTLAATTNCTYCMPYENGRLIFICKGMKTTFQKIWKDERFFI